MPVKESRPWAQDRAAYFNAAYSLLGERGHPGLTVPTLCSRLDVTKGSFYHHFEDLPDFVAAFAGHWQSWMVHYFGTLHAEADLRRRMELVANVAFLCLTDEQRGMRAWAHTNSTVGGVMPAAYRRIQALSWDTFAAMTGDEDTGPVMGSGGLAMAAGLLHRPRTLDPMHLLRMMALWFRAIGVEADWVRVGGRWQLTVRSLQRVAPVDVPAVEVLCAEAPASAWIGGGSTRQRYFGAAGDVLAEYGFDGLTVTALAERLELTKGSFHHHFGTWPLFVEQMAAEWECAETARVDQCLTERQTLRRLERLLADLLVPPVPAETAWRAWAQSDTAVAAAVRRVDTHRETAIAAALDDLIDSPDADLLAEMTLGLALGLHRWYPPLDSTLAARVAVAWMRRVVGIDAEVRTDDGAPRLALSV